MFARSCDNVKKYFFVNFFIFTIIDGGKIYAEQNSGTMVSPW